MNIIALSRDNYLIKGLEYLFPGIIGFKEINNLDDSKDDFVVLIDSRIPLKELHDISMLMNSKNKSVSCVTLRMTLLNNHPGIVHSKQSLAGITNRVIKCKLKKKPEQRNNVVFAVEEPFRKILTLHLAGLSMHSISTRFTCSEKQLYKYRSTVCKQMGYRNIVHAYIHIFTNNLLNENIVIEQDWICDD